MAESYADEQRRRNGLERRAGVSVVQDADAPVTVTPGVIEARHALGRLAAAYDLRCLHDLPPDMCHHCKEKRDAPATHP